MSFLPIIVATALLSAYVGLCAVKLFALWKLSHIQMPEPLQLTSEAPVVPFYYGIRHSPSPATSPR